MQAGVTEEISDTVFEANGAGNEGPAVLSLGLLSYMSGVTFDDNAFYCEEGKFSTEVELKNDSSTMVSQLCERACRVVVWSCHTYVATAG